MYSFSRSCTCVCPQNRPYHSYRNSRNKILTFVSFLSKQDGKPSFLGPSGPSIPSPHFPLPRSARGQGYRRLHARFPSLFTVSEPAFMHIIGKMQVFHPATNWNDLGPFVVRARTRTHLDPGPLQRFLAPCQCCHSTVGAYSGTMPALVFFNDSDSSRPFSCLHITHIVTMLSAHSRATTLEQIRDRQPTSHCWHASRSAARVQRAARLRLLSLLQQLLFSAYMDMPVPHAQPTVDISVHS